MDSAKPLRYEFVPQLFCAMCDDSTATNEVIGIRMNRSQGLRPQAHKGLMVTICQCNNCGLLYADPQPRPIELDDHYGNDPEQYWPATYFEADSQYFSNQLRTLASLSNGECHGRALDIGAGLGKGMLAMERAGFEVYGLEPGVQIRKMAIDRLGILPERLQLTTLENAVYPSNYFKFITFGAVLEHLPKPAEALRRAVQWLEPGGIIHLEVPSAEWLIPRLIDFYYRCLGTRYTTHLSPMHTPYHLFEFTPVCFHKRPKIWG